MHAALQSPDVVLERAAMTPKKWATFELRCADVRKLSTAPAFSNTTVTLTDEADGTRTLAITVKNPTPERPSPAAQAYVGGEITVSLALPGNVVRSNATTHSGRTATWKWPAGDPPSRERLDLTATFRSAS